MPDTVETSTVKLSPGKRVLFLTKDLELIKKQLYEGLKSQGHGRDGTHALQLALNRLSGVDWS